MATIGQSLRAAREKKGVTASQAAAAIRAKVQVVEAMERDDFKRMAAPMYAKSFIKLYAEYLGLDAAPLVREYMELHAPKERSPLVPEEPDRAGDEAAAKRRAERAQAVRKALADLANRWTRRAGIAVGLVVVLVILLLAAGRCSRRVVRNEAPPPAVKRTLGAVIGEPPEPYAEAAGPSAHQP